MMRQLKTKNLIYKNLKFMLNVIRNKKWFLGFSGILVFLSFLSVAIFGFRQGIDLRGGTRWQITMASDGITIGELKEAILSAADFSEVNIRSGERNSFVVRLPDMSEETHQKILNVIVEKFTNVREDGFSSVGPAIGSELRRKSMWAVAIVLLAISAYIALAFRKVSEPVRPWKYGVVTLITLLHDVIIPAGLMAVLGRLKGIEIDTNFIVALLVVMGFSVHDTIVVFDRIRENLILGRGGKNRDLKEVINFSVNETAARSVNTSLTLILVLLALIFVGPASLFYFVLTMLVGTIFGTYSSIFVASPLLYLFQKKRA